MPRRPALARTAAGRQLAALFPADAWTGGGLGITPDEDGAQLDLIEEAQALELRRLDKGPCPDGHCTLQADHAGPCPVPAETLAETMAAAELAAARAIVAERLAEIRAELAEIAAAVGPDTEAGHHVARAFHALEPFTA